MTDSSKYYVFYDGDCGFCNHWVEWILKNDRNDQFLFASLQSDFGQNFLNDRNLEAGNLSTLYLWKPKSFYFKKSQAVFAIARILGGKFAVLGNLNFFPRFLTDAVYDLVAANRQKLYTQKCFLPNEKQKSKFVA
ncbi:thiol-disulfide oxidoreductase DCC family protein [Kaistella palustris]|uniref:thiol-disulfide oxidoreductase DCC family protein n=1 Tax=Kaistella palustris TaxID=493376 RepID=UPI0003F600E3|nr:DCC1-like thiol-disulfide oxidoreductase family protein [Kaistella palustris]